MLVSPAFADRRAALIIGNSNYEYANTLPNTVNDAKAIAGLLKRVGFDVVDERSDVGVVEFKRAVREFLDKTADTDIAVVYYSGHGIEVGGTNYLIPVDAKMANVIDVDDEAVSLDRVLLATQTAKKLSLIIVDACRDNPFLTAQGSLPGTRSLATRLSGVAPTSGDTLIAYAAKGGSLSYDGTGSNSPFTMALVKYIAQPGLDIRIALGKVRDDVLANTGNRQEPFVYGSLGGAFVSLVPAVPASNVPAEARGAVDSDSNLPAGTDYEMAERVATADGWHAFITAHGSGYYAELARAQLAKLIADPTHSGVEITPPSTNPKPPPAVAVRQEVTRPPTKDSKPDRERQVAPAPSDGLKSAEQECKQDEARLAQLRYDPSVQQVTELAQNLACESLRPQVRRLMESIGLEAITPVPTHASVSEPASTLGATASSVSEPNVTVQESKGGIETADSAELCKKEADELSRIRATPDRNSVQRFARDLKCASLKAQAARLLESIGD